MYIMFVIQSSPIFRFLRVSTVIRQDCCYAAAVAVPQRKLQTSLLWYASERRPWHTQAKKKKYSNSNKKKECFLLQLKHVVGVEIGSLFKSGLNHPLTWATEQ